MRSAAPRRRAVVATMAIYVVIAGVLVSGARARAATTWMYVHDVTDFRSVGDVVTYLAELRTGIPPVLSVVEVATYLATGSVRLVEELGYRVALVVAFGLAALVFSRTLVALAACVLLALVFVWATVVLHAGNPELYDVVFPLAALACVACLAAARDVATAWRVSALCACAGFFLSMTELLRPFILLVLPLLLWTAYLLVRPLGRRPWIWFLVPLVVCSGGWHLKLLLLNGPQLTWSNHVGFNLARAWSRDPGYVKPALAPEAPPLAPGRWPNIDTRVHYENSLRLQRAVLWYAVSHPWRVGWKLLRGYAELLRPTTTLYEAELRPPALALLYRVAVWLTALTAAANVCALALVARRGGWRRAFGTPEALVLVLILTSLTTAAIGESGEWARFLMCVLPLLVALPHRLPRLRAVSA